MPQLLIQLHAGGSNNQLSLPFAPGFVGDAAGAVEVGATGAVVAAGLGEMVGTWVAAGTGVAGAASVGFALLVSGSGVQPAIARVAASTTNVFLSISFTLL
ncbi:MAG: hypothetical protein ACR2H6_05180 [Pyrinomonadaceae bacterium]